MRKDFFSKNSRSILIVTVLIGLWLVVLLFNNSDEAVVKQLLNQPKKGQIYIFQDDNVYAPMRVDSVAGNKLYMRNYQFLFADGIPKLEQIEIAEFDTVFYAIYDRKEVNRLFEIGNLVRIYP